MSSHNDVYYDAHIKTHQRHLLITWLESAKSEKIRAMKDSIVIPTKRYVVPTAAPVTPISVEITEEEKQNLRKKFEGINPSVSISESEIVNVLPTMDKNALSERFASIFHASLIRPSDDVSLSHISNSIGALISENLSSVAVATNKEQANTNKHNTFVYEIDKKKFENVRVGVLALSPIPTSEQIMTAISLDTTKFNDIHADTISLSSTPTAKQLGSAVSIDSKVFEDVHTYVTIPPTINFEENAAEINKLVKSCVSGVTLSKNIAPITKAVIPESVVSIKKENNASVLFAVQIPDVVAVPEQDAEDKKRLSEKFTDIYKVVTIPDKLSLQERIDKNRNAAQSCISQANILTSITIPTEAQNAVDTHCDIDDEKFASVTTTVEVPSMTVLPKLFIDGKKSIIGVPSLETLNDILNRNTIVRPDFSDVGQISVSLPRIIPMDFSDIFETLTTD